MIWILISVSIIEFPIHVKLQFFPLVLKEFIFYGSERKIIQYSQNTFIVSSNVE